MQVIIDLINLILTTYPILSYISGKIKVEHASKEEHSFLRRYKQILYITALAKRTHMALGMTPLMTNFALHTLM